MVVAAVVSGGCEYLLLGLQPPPLGPGGSFGTDPSLFPNGSGFALPSPVATFTKGRAAVTIAGQDPIVLERLSPGPHVISDYGTQVQWSNEDGWYLGVMKFNAGLGYDEPAAISLDRLDAHRHWTVWDGLQGCTVTLSRATATGVEGTASCTGLRWSDFMTPPSFDGKATYVDGEAPFDLEATFSASS